jgi:hypothetical protein
VLSVTIATLAEEDGVAWSSGAATNGTAYVPWQRAAQDAGPLRAWLGLRLPVRDPQGSVSETDRGPIAGHRGLLMRLFSLIRATLSATARGCCCASVAATCPAW